MAGAVEVHEDPLPRDRRREGSMIVRVIVRSIPPMILVGNVKERMLGGGGKGLDRRAFRIRDLFRLVRGRGRDRLSGDEVDGLLCDRYIKRGQGRGRGRGRVRAVRTHLAVAVAVAPLHDAVYEAEASAAEVAAGVQATLPKVQAQAQA